jgi:hypothetical protein
MSKIQVIQKIELEGLLDMLTDLYEKGVDYIDIVIPDPKDNKIAIVFSVEYLSEEARTDIEERSEPFLEDLEDDKLSDEDLNQLI